VPQIYLASQSPRRRALLDQIALHYQVLGIQVHEVVRADESPADYVQRVALDKARAGWRHEDRSANRPVLGADTEVVVDDAVLGKPQGREQGLAMLRRLSGRSHRVLSAVALVEGARERVALSVSEVTFRRLTEPELCAYWDSGEPADKAGAYAIQGLGAVFVARLAGSFSGVMGLPLFETARLLRDFGVDVI